MQQSAYRTAIDCTVYSVILGSVGHSKHAFKLGKWPLIVSLGTGV